MRDRYVFPSQDFVRSKGTNSNVIALNFNEIGRISPSAVQILIISTIREIRVYFLLSLLLLISRNYGKHGGFSKDSRHSSFRSTIVSR